MGSMGNKESFTKIYKDNDWGGMESRSGLGSDLSATKFVQLGIASVIAATACKAILDCACGDFNWMREVMKYFSHIKYTGVDIVEEMVAENKKKYGGRNVEFKSLDITTDQLPKADLVICRDCLVHLSFQDIENFLSNFLRSGSSFLLTTSFGDRKNEELPNNKTRWRTLSLQKPPFNLPAPMMQFNEKADQPYCDKSLYLYSREQIGG